MMTMNREQFLKTLKQELRAMPERERNEILADYEEYFRDALAAGRTEEDVARSLGAPRQLARELRAEASIKGWEEKRSLGNFARLFLSVAGLGLVNLMLLLPLLILVTLLLSFFVAAFALIAAGAGLVLASIPGMGLAGFITVDVAGVELIEPLAIALAGVGVFCSGLVWFLFDAWVTKWVAVGLVKYARLNFRLLRGEA